MVGYNKTNKKHTNKHNKTHKNVKQSKKHSQIIKFIQNTMNYLASIKMYHWTTDSFAAHKATDTLYTNLQTFMDSYVETSLGNNNNKSILKNKIKNVKLNNVHTNKSLHTYTNNYKKELQHIRKTLDEKQSSNLLNIIDEILAELDVLLYLLTLN